MCEKADNSKVYFFIASPWKCIILVIVYTNSNTIIVWYGERKKLVCAILIFMYVCIKKKKIHLWS